MALGHEGKTRETYTKIFPADLVHIDSQALSLCCVASQQLCFAGKEEEGLGKEVERKKGNQTGMLEQDLAAEWKLKGDHF